MNVFTAQTFRPIRPLCPFHVEGVAFGHEAPADGDDGRDGIGKNVVFRGDPAQGHSGLDLIDPPRAALRAFSAGRAAPDVFAFDLGQAEGRLPDDLAHAEAPDPVPRADGIAQSALIAGFESFAAVRLDGVDDFFKGATVSMRIPDPVLSPLVLCFDILATVSSTCCSPYLSISDSTPISTSAGAASASSTSSSRSS